jgi:hypothetical protein
VRVAALWLLWGTDKMKNPRLPLRAGSREEFDATLEKMPLPGLVRYNCQRGMIALRGCGMNVAYPYTWLMAGLSNSVTLIATEMMLSNSVKLIATELPERFYIGGVPEEAWDKHTRQGKAAYTHFYKACSPVSEFLTSLGVVGNDEIVKAIGISLFISESALLDRRVDFDGAEQVYMMTRQDDFEKNGLTLDDGKELSRLIQENHEVLRRSRQAIVEGKRR